MPDQRLYSLVFRHLLYLQANGEAPEVAGAPSPSIAHFYSDRVGATSSENVALLAEAKAWKAEVDPIDQKAHAIILAIRAKTSGGHLSPGQQPPPVPPELIELQQQRDAVTLKHVASLKASLGEARFGAIDNQIRRATHLSYKTGRITGPASAKGDNETDCSRFLYPPVSAGCNGRSSCTGNLGHVYTLICHSQGFTYSTTRIQPLWPRVLLAWLHSVAGNLRLR
jgi:hypothetical protein